MAHRVIFAIASLLYVGALAQQNPYEPTGFPVVSSARRLPPPAEQGVSYELKIIESEVWELEGSLVTGKKVTFEYRGYRVSAQDVLGDLDQQQFSLKGNVTAEGADETLHGSHLFVDFRSRSFRIAEGGADIRDSFAEGRLRGTLFLNSSEVVGNRQKVTAAINTLTSCEYPNPHFVLESRLLELQPERRLYLRDVRLSILGKTIIGVPEIMIPLDKRTPTIVPEVGSSVEEGYYTKLRWGVPVGSDNLVARVDARSKRGIGIGADFTSSQSSHRMDLQVYGDVTSKDVAGLTGTARYNGEFSFGKVEATQDYRRFSFLTGVDNESFATQVALSFRSSGTTRVVLTNYDQHAGSFRSSNRTASLSDSRRWSNRLSSQFQMSLSDLRASSGADLNRRSALDVRIGSSYDAGEVIAQLDYSRNVPIGSTLNFISGIDRTPELTIRTDRQRVFRERHPSWMPNFYAQFAVGNYRDNFNAVDVARYFLDVRLQQPIKEAEGFAFGYDLGFKQGIYGKDAAQYTPIASILTRYRVPGLAQLNFRYNYSRPHGFTPIQSDRSGAYNFASVDMLAEILRGLTFGGQVGYDFNRAALGDVAWVSPAVRIEYKPNEQLRFRTQANYLPQINSWGNIRLDFAWKPGPTFIGVTARYDALQQKWGNVNLYIDALTIGRMKLSTLLLYNGYLTRFNSAHFSITYDLHCAEAVLQVLDNNVGFRPGREVLFFIRLKALPFDSPFGVGRLGQPLDIGTGGW